MPTLQASSDSGTLDPEPDHVFGFVQLFGFVDFSFTKNWFAVFSSLLGAATETETETQTETETETRLKTLFGLKEVLVCPVCAQECVKSSGQYIQHCTTFMHTYSYIHMYIPSTTRI